MFKEMCEQVGLTKENIRNFSDPVAWFFSFMFATVLLTLTLVVTRGLTESGTLRYTGWGFGDIALWFFYTLMIRWAHFAYFWRIAQIRRIIWSEIPEGRKKKKRLIVEEPEQSDEEFVDAEIARRRMTLM